MALTLVYTDAMRIRLAELHSDFGATFGPNSPLKIKQFKLGIGNVDGAGDPLPPDPTFTDLDSPTFTKALTVSDVSDDAAGTLTVVCNVLTTEANDSPDPLYTEIGIYTDEDVLLVHGSYGPQVKNTGNSLQFSITIPY